MQVEHGTIEGIRPKRGCPVIHPLLFVNDSIFFIKGEADKGMNLKRTIEEY